MNTSTIQVEATTLVSLAILKVDLDEGTRDYLDYLRDFALHVLSIHKPDPVTDDILSDLLLKEFGLNLPNRACQLVLRRLARKRFLKREHNVFTLEEELPQIDFTVKRNTARHHIDLVYSSVKKYALNRYGLTWTDSDVTLAILSFLGNFGVEFLRAYIFKTALPSIPESAPKEQFIVSKFIKELYDSGHQLFDSFAVLVKGQMYANALVCPDLESISKKFDRLTFYFDTPLILNFLNLQGPEEKAAIDELLPLIKQLRGKVAVFDHTFEEVRNVLSAAENNLDNPTAEGTVIREIRKLGMAKTNLILLREKLPEHLKAHDISIMPTPEYNIDFQISEQELEEAILDEVWYRNPQALRFDINSVRSIYVLREGHIPTRLEDAIAVFVTSNSKLAKAAFLLGQNHNSTREVSSIITDYSLANVAWLKAPMGAPELPTKEMLATCYAALEPSHALWSKYINEIDSLVEAQSISADDHAILRVSPLATNELMNLTLGEETALTGGSVRKILERVKADLVKEKDEEIEEHRLASESLATEVRKLREDTERAKANLFWFCGKVARLSGILFKAFMLFVLLLAGFASSNITTALVLNSTVLTSLTYALVILAVSWGLLNWYSGVSVRELARNLENRIQQRTFKLLLRVQNLTS